MKVVDTKLPIFEIRKQKESWMDDLTKPIQQFLINHNFYPKVFYNENDINHLQMGIRAAIPTLDQYDGVFVVQDSPDTPIDGFHGVEFRLSISKDIKNDCDHPQLLFINQDHRSLPQLPHSEYNESPSVQFVGTIVYTADGRIFPQQQAREVASISLATSGLLNQTYNLIQQFRNGQFIEIRGERLSKPDYFKVMEQHPYGLSVRGWGNYSDRFYELMASGRIPVHVHTNDELLFEDWIGYDQYIVKVNDIRNIKKDVESFHDQFTDNRSLHAHQDKLRKLHDDYLNYPAFVKYFEEYYEDVLSK